MTVLTFKGFQKQKKSDIVVNIGIPGKGKCGEIFLMFYNKTLTQMQKANIKESSKITNIQHYFIISICKKGFKLHLLICIFLEVQIQVRIVLYSRIMLCIYIM